MDRPSRESIAAAARDLIALQRDDGGWAQQDRMVSDAYATGEALAGLRAAKAAALSEAPYRNGVEFLLRTQYEDGTWFLETRSVPIQATSRVDSRTASTNGSLPPQPRGRRRRWRWLLTGDDGDGGNGADVSVTSFHSDRPAWLFHVPVTGNRDVDRIGFEAGEKRREPPVTDVGAQPESRHGRERELAASEDTESDAVVRLRFGRDRRGDGQ
jgi:hypothetical protein